MPKIRLNGIDYECTQEVINHVDAVTSKLSEVTKTVKTLTSEKDKITAERDKNKEKLDDIEKELPGKLNDLVQKRLDVFRVADKVLKKEDLAKLDTMSDIDIMKKIITIKRPKADLKDKSEDYISIRFDDIIETLEDETKKKNDGLVTQRQTIYNSLHTDEGKVKIDAEEARNKMINHLQGSWQGKKEK